MRITSIINLFAGIMLFLFVPTSSAQDTEQVPDSLKKDAVNMFLDCHRCDMNHIRREIPYINYVRDVREADVYVLQTRQSTGSGGTEYTYTFHGQGRFSGLNDTLVYNSRPDDTMDFTRNGTTKMLAMGLLRYVAKTPQFHEVDIESKGEARAEEVVDNWDYWVFELDFDPEFEFEESRSSLNWENSFNSSRITPAMKFELDAEMRLRRTKYNYDDTTFVRDRNSWSLENITVFSLSDHWSAGFRTDLRSSTYSNIELSWDFFPSLEYNLFPYAESTRRQLRFLYGVGYAYYDYFETTIYEQDKESLFEQSLDIAYRIQQKWGSINVSLEASNYLHDFSKNRFELDGWVSIRIIKGLSFSIRGSAARINNQLGLPKGDLDEAEILLELQELRTTYSIDGGIGLTYTFGSIYNNVVNPRFGNGRW